MSYGGNGEPYDDLLPFPLSVDDKDAQRDYVRLLCTVTGFDTTNLARSGPVSASTLNKFMNEDNPVKHNLSAKTLAKIRAGAIRELRRKFGDDRERIRDRVNQVLSMPVLNGHKEGAPRESRTSVSLFRPEPPDFRRSLPPPDQSNTIPICAIEGGRLVEIGASRRPRSLESVKGGYAIYMAGVHMRPRYDSGWLLYVNPHKPPARGRNVVVYKNDGTYIIAQFDHEELNGDIVLRHGVTKDAPELLVAASEIRKIDLIVGSDEE